MNAVSRGSSKPLVHGHQASEIWTVSRRDVRALADWVAGAWCGAVRCREAPRSGDNGARDGRTAAVGSDDDEDG